MPAPLGNQYALGCLNSGAPRTVSFPPDEMIKLGEEMVKWVNEHPEILHLSEWYTIHKMFTYKQWKTFIQCNEFLPYYEVALKIVGRKYLDKDSKVRDGISHRWQRIYFPDLKDQEDADADAEVLRKKEIEGSKKPVQYIMVPDGLSSGTPIPTPSISKESN